LVLSCRRHLAFARQVVEKRGHLLRAHFGRMTLAGKVDNALDPVDVRVLGASAVVAHGYRITHAVE